MGLVGKIPLRLIIAAMIFTGAAVEYMMRANLSVLMVAMVPVTNHTNYTSQTTLDWTPYERAQVLSGFFWGYIVGCLLGGTVSDMFGPRIALSLSILSCSIFTSLCPVAAKYSYIALLVLRVLMGLVSGVVFPALHVIVSKWAVDAEKGRFVGAIVGGTIGTFIAWTICGVIIEPFGWESGFYLFGIIGILWVVIFWFVVYDTPEQHPRISERELRYIQEGISNKEIRKVIPPYLKLVKSVPLWSIAIANFGSGWGIYFVITAAPNYLASALGYGTSSTGMLSALIYLARCSCAMAFGYAGDYMLKNNLLSIKVLRKLACVCSHVVPGCIVICMAIPNYDPIFYVTLIIVAMSFNGFVPLSTVANVHDLSKNFVGTVYGIINTFSTAAGIISPFVTAYFTREDETNQDLWKPVFYTGGSVFIISGLQFLVFGSSERQSWDLVPENDILKQKSVLE